MGELPRNLGPRTDDRRTGRCRSNLTPVGGISSRGRGRAQAPKTAHLEHRVQQGLGRPFAPMLLAGLAFAKSVFSLVRHRVWRVGADSQAVAAPPARRPSWSAAVPKGRRARERCLRGPTDRRTQRRRGVGRRVSSCGMPLVGGAGVNRGPLLDSACRRWEDLAKLTALPWKDAFPRRCRPEAFSRVGRMLACFELLSGEGAFKGPPAKPPGPDRTASRDGTTGSAGGL